MEDSKLISTDKFVAPGVPEQNNRREFMKINLSKLLAAGLTLCALSNHTAYAASFS